MNRLSSKHYVFFLLVVSLVSLRGYSSIFLKIGGRDTWLAALIAGLIFILYAFFIFYVSKKTSTYDIRDVFNETYPKIVSNFLLLLFSVGLFLDSIESAAAQCDSIHSNIFIETPIWYCLLFFIIPGMYLITKRIDTLVVVIIFTVLVAIGSDIITEIFTAQYQHPLNCLPILPNGFTNDFLMCIAMSLGSFCSIAIVFPFLRYVNKNEHLVRNTTLTTLVIVVIVVFSFFMLVATFGRIRSGNISYPEFVAAQRIQIKGFIEFGDLLFFMRTIPIWLVKYVLCAVSILYLFKDKFTNKRIFAVIYSIAAYICAYLVGKNHFLLFEFLKYYQFVVLALLGIVPFLTYLIFFIKWKKKIKA
ncbi:GerAB/ArcD/ProY family transporter [Clostridium sp.]|uniref:GerAB/ArcD/ProY family transporter n=1 Tax=Clostridium sp. TaxID=1506 RepID=UPI002FCB9F48